MKTARYTTILLACLLLAALAVGLTFGLRDSQPAYGAEQPSAKLERSALLSLQNAFTSIAEELKPSVVFITAERTTTTPGMPDLEDFFRGFPFGPDIPLPRGQQRQRSTAAGSGVIVRSDGYILTNDHVVASAEHVTVKLNDGREFSGKVLRDPRTDLALIKIDATGLPAAKLGDSDKVKVGQWAIAIGSPFGLTNTVTVGVISALTRSAEVADPEAPGGARHYPDLIQTDASINMGNSGGPLVNIDGEVVGINSVIESPTRTNAGVGFAVPANTARYVMDTLIAQGKVTWGYMGLEIRDVSPAAAKTLGIDKGALVNSVEEDKPAAKAGIKPMDVIVEVNGKKVDDSLALRRIVERIKPGTKVPVVLVREGKRQTVQVAVGEAPNATTGTTPEGKTKLGLSVQELTPALAERLGVDSDTAGVFVKSVDPDGAAARARPPISAGDLITKINGKPTKNVAQFDKAVAALKPGDTALVLIQRGGRTTICEVPID